eukprot:PITA_28734
MDEELEQIDRNNTWELVPRPKDKNVIGTKWIIKNKMNENGEVIRNKAILVCKWYAQQEGIDFEETFSPVARLEAIRMFLALSSFQKFKVFQMDVESTFPNGDVEEEVYIEKPDGTRPDIMHAMGIVGRFQANPKETHLQAVKRIFKYLQGTQNYGLWYPRDTDLTLHVYTDADWAGRVDDRKSTSGGAFFMGSRLVSWFIKKQSSITLSTAEVEYVVDASCCTQLLWMMQTLQDFQITCTPPISILCDNTSAINISKNPVMHSKTKHIPIKYHFLGEQVLEQKVKLEYVPSKEQVVDILTKPLPRENFEYLRQKLGVVDASSCC